MQIELTKQELALLLYLFSEVGELESLTVEEDKLKTKLQEIFDSTI